MFKERILWPISIPLLLPLVIPFRMIKTCRKGILFGLDGLNGMWANIQKHWCAKMVGPNEHNERCGAVKSGKGLSADEQFYLLLLCEMGLNGLFAADGQKIGKWDCLGAVKTHRADWRRDRKCLLTPDNPRRTRKVRFCWTIITNMTIWSCDYVTSNLTIPSSPSISPE